MLVQAWAEKNVYIELWKEKFCGHVLQGMMGSQWIQTLWSDMLPMNAKIKALSKSIFTKLHKYHTNTTFCRKIILLQWEMMPLVYFLGPSQGVSSNIRLILVLITVICSVPIQYKILTKLRQQISLYVTNTL